MGVIAAASYYLSDTSPPAVTHSSSSFLSPPPPLVSYLWLLEPCEQHRAYKLRWPYSPSRLPYAVALALRRRRAIGRLPTHLTSAFATDRPSEACRRRCVLRASLAERPGLPVWPHSIPIFVADASNVTRRSVVQVEATLLNAYG